MITNTCLSIQTMIHRSKRTMLYSKSRRSTSITRIQTMSIITRMIMARERRTIVGLFTRRFLTSAMMTIEARIIWNVPHISEGFYSMKDHSTSATRSCCPLIRRDQIFTSTNLVWSLARTPLRFIIMRTILLGAVRLKHFHNKLRKLTTSNMRSTVELTQLKSGRNLIVLSMLTLNSDT